MVNSFDTQISYSTGRNCHSAARRLQRGKRLFTAHTHPPLHVAQNICYGTHTQTNSIWLAIWQQHEVSTNNNELTFISPPLNPFLRTYSDLSSHHMEGWPEGALAY